MASHAAELAPVLPPIKEQMTDAVMMVAPYEQARAEGRRLRDIDEAQDIAMQQVASDIFDTLGVSQEEEAVGSWEYGTYGNHLVPRSAVLLRRASDTAGEAIALGYSPELPEDDLRAKAGELIADYKNFEAAHPNTTDKDNRYTDRRAAKMLLIESAVRELARRNGVNGSLTVKSLREIQAATGVQLVDREYPHVFQSVITPRTSVLPRPPRRQPNTKTRDWYHIPELAGPHTQHRGGWVAGRIGHFALDPRYTNGRLPR